MSNKKIRELRNLSKAELENRLRDSQAGLFQSKVKKVTGQLEDASAVWKARKEIARIKTILSQPKAAEAK